MGRGLKTTVGHDKAVIVLRSDFANQLFEFCPLLRRSSLGRDNPQKVHFFHEIDGMHQARSVPFQIKNADDPFIYLVLDFREVVEEVSYFLARFFQLAASHRAPTRRLERPSKTTDKLIVVCLSVILRMVKLLCFVV